MTEQFTAEDARTLLQHVKNGIPKRNLERAIKNIREAASIGIGDCYVLIDNEYSDHLVQDLRDVGFVVVPSPSSFPLTSLHITW